MANPRVIVLLGMHRSGTSLTASILEALGVDFGSDYIPANENNPKGYFEDAAISRVHLRVNRMLNRRPFSPSGLLEYPQSFWRSRQAIECTDELEMLVCRQLERTSGIWGFKDPHTIKLLPLWQELFERLEITPVYILAVRHPSEVAASTVKRDHVTAGQGELLWIDQNIAALHNTAYNIAVVTDYATWFSDPLLQANRIIDALGLERHDDADLQAILDNRIDPALHHLKNTGDTYLPYARELYGQLLSVIGGVDLVEATRPLVVRYQTAKSLFDPALEMLEREYQLRRKKDQELELLCIEKDREIHGLNRRINNIVQIVKVFLGSRTGIFTRQYQMARRRLFNKNPEGALLVKIERILDEGS